MAFLAQPLVLDGAVQMLVVLRLTAEPTDAIVNNRQGMVKQVRPISQVPILLLPHHCVVTE